MGIFGALDTSATGLHVYRTWMDAISDNMANLNTVRPTSESAFQARFVEVSPIGPSDPTSAPGTPDGAAAGVGAGAQVTAVVGGDPAGRLVYQPGSPLADANGMVRYPDIDLGDQMTQLMLAQRGYQANLAVVDRAKEAYQAALEIGK